MRSLRLDPAQTWHPDFGSDAVQSDAPADATLRRRQHSLVPEVPDLPDLTWQTPLGLTGLDLLGEGGMGRVHAAWDGLLDRTVAIKRPHEAAGPAEQAAVCAEARVLAALDHPRIVPVHGLGRGPDGEPTLVMKRVEGRAWSDLLREGRDLPRDLGVLRAVCEALEFAHARGWLHRDVKPDNVMVGAFGEVYLMDWGCACALHDARTDRVVGTPVYMAPEMVRVGAPLGPATDVFLVGATLHQVLTGRTLREGPVKDVLREAWRGELPEADPDVPEELDTLFRRACARDPADRLARVSEVAAALADFERHGAARALAAQAGTVLGPLARAVEEDQPEADALFLEGRVGFRAAQQAWPACPEARRGMAEAAALYLPLKLRRRELSAAAALIEELAPEDRAPWRAHLQAAEEAQATADRARTAHDLGVAARERRQVAASAFVTCAVLAGAAMATQPTEGFSAQEQLLLGVVPVVVLGGCILAFRRRVFTTRASTTLMIGLMLATVVSLLNRAFAWAREVPVDVTLGVDCLLFGTVLALLGLATDATLGLAVLPWALGLTVIVVRPESASLVFPIASMGSLMAVLLVFRRRERVEDGEAGDSWLDGRSRAQGR